MTYVQIPKNNTVKAMYGKNFHYFQTVLIISFTLPCNIYDYHHPFMLIYHPLLGRNISGDQMSK